MGSSDDFKKDKKVLEKDVRRLAHLGVLLLDSTEGGVVMINGLDLHYCQK